MFNYDKYAYFVLTQSFAGRGSRGFTGYTDSDLNTHFIWDGKKDDKGYDVPRKFKFSLKERTMRIPLNQTDKNGKSVVEFLENHPGCKGSPNATSGNYLFSKIDTENDASIAIDAKTLRINAENFVLSLEKDDAIDLATLFGLFTDKYKLALHCLLENAGTEPEGFMSIADDTAIKHKVQLKRALATGLFKRKGGIIKWESEIIGADEESAIQRLMKDSDLSDSVQINLKK